MFFLYILRSKKDGNLYIGSTNNLKRGIKEHNAGEVDSTRPRRPLALFYYEAYTDEEDARKLEKQLKINGRALGQLKRRLQNSLQQADK